MTGIEKWTLDEEFQHAGGRRWVALIDGSEHSRFAAFHAASLMKLDRDRLTLLGVRTNDSENLVSEALAKTDELLNSWPHGRVPHDILQLKAKKSKIGRKILEYINDKEVSFVVLGHKGIGNEKIMQGTIVDFLTRKALIPVIVVGNGKSEKD